MKTISQNIEGTREQIRTVEQQTKTENMTPARRAVEELVAKYGIDSQAIIKAVKAL